MKGHPGWHPIISADNRYELWMPPEAQLTEFLEATPGEKYYSWSPGRGIGTFSILRRPLPGQTPPEMLELEISFGAQVSVEVDIMVNHHGQPMHQMQFRSNQHIQREILEDPESGKRTHTPAYEMEEVVKYLFWRDEKESIKVGYRANLNGPEGSLTIFETILQSFRLLNSMANLGRKKK
jgi:hypothetical protein